MSEDSRNDCRILSETSFCLRFQVHKTYARNTSETSNHIPVRCNYQTLRHLRLPLGTIDCTGPDIASSQQYRLRYPSTTAKFPVRRGTLATSKLCNVWLSVLLARDLYTPTHSQLMRCPYCCSITHSLINTEVLTLLTMSSFCLSLSLWRPMMTRRVHSPAAVLPASH